MKQKTLSKVFVWGFLVLYVLVALISFVHAVAFFNIGNVSWMSICLAAAFEMGLALSLCSILLSENNKKNALPWVLMIVLTFVQVVGNVYATFSHIAASEVDYYQNLAKPLLFFLEDVPEETVQVIISWIMGAILPIVALMMTDMIASNIKMQAESPVEPETVPVEPLPEPVIKPEIVRPTTDTVTDASVATPAAEVLEEPASKKFMSRLKSLWNAK